MTMSETAISRWAISSPFRSADVQAEALLVDICIIEVARGVQVDLKVLRGRRTRQPAALVLRPFDLDDLGTESTQPARRPRTRPHPAKVDDPNTRQSLHARNAFFCLCPIIFDLLTSDLHRQPLVCGGAQQAERLCSIL